MQGPHYPEFKNASVLITGGGSGIGGALTTAFVAQGAKVAFIDIDANASQALVGSLGAGDHAHTPLWFNVDLRDIDALRKACEDAALAHGPISILINNAARDDRHDIGAVDEAYWEDNLAINLRHQFFAIQAVIEGMKAAGGGTIVNFTSVSFMMNMGNMPAYTTSKAGVIGLTKGMAGALGPHGIRVNAVAPGWIMTERQRELWVTEQALDEFMKRQCIKRPLEPEEMAGPCLFLASQAASAITAQTIIADGGAL